MKLNFNNLKYLGSGASSDAYIAEESRVLLVGKREDSFELYKNLYNKTKLINGKILSVKISDNIELIEPSKKFKFGAMLQNYVEGTELKQKLNELSNLEKEEIGSALAKFILEMQQIDCSFSKEEEIKINLAKLEKSLNLLKNYVSNDVMENLNKVYIDYENFMENTDFCLTHGDLQEANILIGSNNKLSGIIDFGNMEYYVPEVEFAPMMGVDAVIFNSMLKHFNRKIELKNIYLVKLVRHIRHFKHVISLGEDEIQRYVKLILNLLKMQNIK